MRRSVLAIFVVLIMLGSLLVFFPNAAACHKFIVICSPTEKDIVNNDTWTVTFEIDVELRPGCGSKFWVGFTVSTADPGFYRNLYEKTNSTKNSIYGTSPPSDGEANNWEGWIDVGTDNPAHYYAVLEVWCDPNTENWSNTTITVDAWSTDNNNDLYNREITTKTTVNIPNRIMFHTNPEKSIQWVEPGEWAEFDITVEDMIGDLDGQIDLYKDPKSWPCFDDDWEWSFLNNVTIEQPYGTAEFTLKIKPPSNAKDGVFAYFFIYGENHNSSYNHTIWVKTIVDIPKPDLSCENEVGIINIELLGEDYSDGETYTLSIDVYNLGEIEVSNFVVAFIISIVGGGKDTIGTKNIIETLAPGKYVNVQHPWVAIEGIHWLCIALDPGKSILEEDEITNNGCGVWAEVGEPLIPEKIVLKMSIEPTSIGPHQEFIVTGKAIYNPEFGSLPLNNSDVKVTIQETNATFNAKTAKDGRFEIKCISPGNVGTTYTIIVKCIDGTLEATLIGDLRVAKLQVTAKVQSSHVLAGKNITIVGNVTDSTFAVKDANVTVSLLDEDNIEVLSEPVIANTDQNGIFYVTIALPVATEVMEYTLKINASKKELFGVQTSKILVDIEKEDDEQDNFWVDLGWMILVVITAIIIVIIIIIYIKAKRKR